MILGISHIVLGSSDIANDIPYIQKLGYQLQFQELTLPTAPQKRLFMKESSDHQAMAFLQSKQGIAIELICYGNKLVPLESPWRLIAPNAPSGNQTIINTDTIWPGIAEMTGVKTSSLERFQTEWHWNENSTSEQIALVAPDITAERLFFTAGLSCTHTAQGANWATLKKKSPFPQWNMDFILIENKSARHEPYLDGSGFRCLSFLCSDLDQDHERVMQSGGVATSGTFELVVNSKRLRLAMVQSPSGALIELMQLPKSR